MKTLSITRRVSNAYRPESQGTLEGWHQTFKSVLRIYCLKTGKDWEEDVLFALIAVTEIQRLSSSLPLQRLSSSQKRMKTHFDKDDVPCYFDLGDQV